MDRLIRKATRDTSLWQRDGAMTPNRYSTMCKLKSTGMALLQVAVSVILLFPNDGVPNDNNVLGILFGYKSYYLYHGIWRHKWK